LGQQLLPDLEVGKSFFWRQPRHTEVHARLLGVARALSPLPLPRPAYLAEIQVVSVWIAESGEGEARLLVLHDGTAKSDALSFEALNHLLDWLVKHQPD